MSIITEKKMTAEEAAIFIKHDEAIGFSGFTPAGYPKVIPGAIARKAEALHAAGEPFQIGVYTGASTGDELDGVLARAKAIKKRLPYQSNSDLRKGISDGSIEFIDFHLSHIAQYIRYGFLQPPRTAIVEAVDVTDDGKVYLSMSGGMSASYMMMADRIFIELNRYLPQDLKGIHDVFVPDPPPTRQSLNIFTPSDRIGRPYVKVDPAKIIGIVETNLPDTNAPFRAPDEISQGIAANVIEFLLHEAKMGRLPKNLPFQSGVGNVANAVLSAFATTPGLDPIRMYTEVIQDSIFELIDNDRLDFASTTSLTFSKKGQERFLSDLSKLKNKFVIRQQEISNHPELIRRLGVISMNTPIEMDIFGNINSTHIMGSTMQNGIGGSGDFCRNAYISFFCGPSIAKDGKISCVVPMVSHVDHHEHSVQVVCTEQGLADLRGLGPVKKARLIIEKCAHPDYKELLLDYLKYGLANAPSKHTPHILSKAFDFHNRFLATGSMQPS